MRPPWSAAASRRVRFWTCYARWPEVFGAPVPLAIGIAREIRQSLGEMPISKMRLSQALHF